VRYTLNSDVVFDASGDLTDDGSDNPTSDSIVYKATIGGDESEESGYGTITITFIA